MRVLSVMKNVEMHAKASLLVGLHKSHNMVYYSQLHMKLQFLIHVFRVVEGFLNHANTFVNTSFGK